MPIMFLSLAWDGRQSELNTIAEHTVLPRILRLEGVADVDLQGIRRREIIVELDRDVMSSHGIDISRVQRSLRANNINLSAGSIIGQRSKK